ncbi:hypothetical protein [Streptomyces canarius]|uniref:Uncharacterized protein n=1 Tax=Streptomyces canarius TaxID=285453 RepID=A0ABQ3D6C3_9ACTN|nr:hypothetical protein GCM10010345_74460 [Streptomyces canarius]
MWGEVTGKTSGAPHGGAIDPARAAASTGNCRRRSVTAGGLPDRAARVVEPAALTRRGGKEARDAGERRHRRRHPEPP